MHIWLAASAFSPHRGGVEELTLKIAQHLTTLGHSVLVLAPRHPTSLPVREHVEGIDVLRLDLRAPRKDVAASLAWLTSRRSVQRLLDLQRRPDVVHVICPSVQLEPLGRWARRHGVPVVLTTQGETEMDANAVYASSPWMRYVLRREARRAAVLTACSTWTAEHAARVASSFTGARVVLNGVDPDDWAITEPPDAPVVAAWGRHVPQKGLDLLVRAFPLVRAEIPAARLLLGGHGEQTAELQALASEGVALVGSLDRVGVRALLEQARVVVVPSRVEPFGIVAVEALAAGRALVHSTHGGLGEAAGGCGIAVDPDDSVALAAAVVMALRQPADTGPGRRRAAELSWSSITRQYVDLYDLAITRA